MRDSECVKGLDFLRKKLVEREKQFKLCHHEKNKTDVACSKKLLEGVKVVDEMVKELEVLRAKTRKEEDRQFELLAEVSRVMGIETNFENASTK